jgi:SAM-dependent methyltransferase
MTLAIDVPATDLYASALRGMSEPGGHRHWYARYEGGPRRSLGEALRRWCGTVDATDQDLLDRSPGAVLDAGCGPGRLVIELARQGRHAVGLDTSRVAVRLARGGGATALCRSIFDPVPGEGRWDTVLLADGNIGIGGDPVALLRRCRELLTENGTVLLELEPDASFWRGHAYLESTVDDGEMTSPWFPWAVVGPGAVTEVARDAGLAVTARADGSRTFVELSPTT